MRRTTPSSAPRRPGSCHSAFRLTWPTRSASLSAIPFNPVYLFPLVEIVAGERTSAETRRTRRLDFYDRSG